MDHIWWDYTYNPGTRVVKVRRWRKRGSMFAAIEVEYEGLTWAEAQDVLENDATYVLLMDELEP